MRQSFLPNLAFSLGMCLLVGLGTALLFFDLPASRVTESWALRINFVVLVILVLLLLVQSCLTRSVAKILFACAGLLMLTAIAQFFLCYLDGALHLGEGENAQSWAAVQRGPLARYPGLVFLGKTPDGIRLSVDGNAEDFVFQKWRSITGGLAVWVEEVHDAPVFFIKDLEGRTLYEGFIKLGAGDAQDQYISVGLLPHRFYLSSRENTLHLMVLRGKLKVVEQDVVLGQPVEFEGKTFSIGQGSVWAEIRVRYRFAWFLPSLSGVLLGLGMILRKSL